MSATRVERTFRKLRAGDVLVADSILPRRTVIETFPEAGGVVRWTSLDDAGVSRSESGRPLGRHVVEVSR